MIRIVLVGLGGLLLLANSAAAQSYCDQVRQAVTTYGYTSAKRYAVAHYSSEAVKAAERCLSRADK